MTTIQSFLDKFGGFDGGVVQAIEFRVGSMREQNKVAIQIKAFCDIGGDEYGWHLVTLQAFDVAWFGWIEARWNTNLVFNFPVEVTTYNDIQIVDFDPLHATVAPSGMKVELKYHPPY